MANLKNITELPLAESAEGLNLIVNDNGAAKQIPASAVGGNGGVFVMDMTTLTPPDLTNTDYGNTVKEALLNGRTVLQYDGNYYFQVVAFKIVETTTGEVFLYIYTYSQSTTGGVNSSLNDMTLPITL